MKSAQKSDIVRDMAKRRPSRVLVFDFKSKQVALLGSGPALTQRVSEAVAAQQRFITASADRSSKRI